MNSIYPNTFAQQRYRYGPHHQRLRLLDAYYSVLCDQPTFGRHLSILFEQLRPHHDHRLSTDPIERYLRDTYDAMPDGEEDTPLGRLTWNTRRWMPLEASSLIDAFIDPWRLPADAVIDVWWCSSRWPMLSRTNETDPRPLRVTSRITEMYELTAARIYPSVPLSFVYAPADRAADWIAEESQKIADQVKASILDQARVIEAEVRAEGWDVMAPRSANDADLRRRALRYYRATVEGLTIAQILAREQCETSESAPGTPQAIGQSVKTFATALRARFRTGSAPLGG